MNSGIETPFTARDSATPPPSAQGALDGNTKSNRAGSPAFSTTSTAAEGGTSPVLPPLPAPRLPDRVQDFLRTPSPTQEERDDSSQYQTASWGSPFPDEEVFLSGPSSGSEQSEDSPIHHLEINTPFLRPAPLPRLQGDQRSTFVSAAILANRARRPAQGLTEDWIRQHTANGLITEGQAWLSDGSEDEQQPSLLSATEDDWLDQDQDQDPPTPRANPNKLQRQLTYHQPNGTITQTQIPGSTSAMVLEEPQPQSVHQALQPQSLEASNGSFVDTPTNSITPDLSEKPRRIASMDNKGSDSGSPSTPGRAMRKEPAETPRVKVKVPWNGKNIMVLLPRDEERGHPGRPPMPLTFAEATARVNRFKKEGYDTSPFSLKSDRSGNSVSKSAWPDPTEIVRERASREYAVVLPDLNRWKEHVAELQEAKLRALGVTFGEEEAPEQVQQQSPVLSIPARNTSAQYPPLPFSPPVRTGSGGSSHAFSFAPQVPLASSAGQSPNLSINSPLSFNGSNLSKHRPGQSIAIPGAEFHSQFQSSPHNLYQQAMLQQMSGNGSPSLIGVNPPGSPYENGGFPPPVMPPAGHARTQSLQYPMIHHQQHLQISARASPRLQELREDEEEDVEEQMPHHRLNANDDLQREIDEAEYHLEEQFKAQLEEDEYSPHHEPSNAGADLDHVNSALNSHLRQQSVQFLEPARNDNLVLHHPTPHSRGHSLSKKFLADHDEGGTSTEEGSIKAVMIQTSGFDKPVENESFEIETNPSDLGTPVDNFQFSNMAQAHSFSDASNPWKELSSRQTNGESHSRRGSHSSKASLSSLNVDAPEFKFSGSGIIDPPQSSFTFGSKAQQGSVVFKASAPEFTPSVFTNHTSQNSTSSSGGGGGKINAEAPVFSPRSLEFDFSASGPKFRADAPAFTPSFARPIGSPASDGANSSNAIFSTIDLTSLDIVKPARKSKAIPIVKPAYPPNEERDGRLANNSPPKRIKAADDGDRSVPRFSNSPEPSKEAVAPPEPAVKTNGEAARLRDGDELVRKESEAQVVDKAADHDVAAPADITTLSSTIVSESADSKAATSPEATSPEQPSFNWVPFELRSQAEVQSFNQGRPLSDEEPFGTNVAGEAAEPAKKHHKKTLSATAKPFTPGAFSWTDTKNLHQAEEVSQTLEYPGDQRTPTTEEPINKTEVSAATRTVEVTPDILEPASAATSSKGFGASRFATDSEPPKAKGLAASRFASQSLPSSPPPPKMPEPEKKTSIVEVEAEPRPEPEPKVTNPTIISGSTKSEPPAKAPSPPQNEPGEVSKEPSFEEIDSVMRHLSANPDKGVNRMVDPTKWQNQSPTRDISATAITDVPTVLQPPVQVCGSRSDAPSPSPHRFGDDHPILSTEVDDTFIMEHPDSAIGSGIHNLNGDVSPPASEWDHDFSDGQQEKFEERVPYFDRHVIEIVGNLFDDKLEVMQENIVKSLAPSSRRERRSVSAERQPSDADDEDEEPVPRRSTSPRRNGRYELTKAAVSEVLNTHHVMQPPATADTSNIMRLLEDMSAKLGQKDAESTSKMAKMQGRLEELEEQLRAERTKNESEVTLRREAQDAAAELKRSLADAGSRLERENVVKTTSEARATDLEERINKYEQMATSELEGRRAAEDKLSEIQRQLRISSEEEYRLRDLLEEKEQKIRAVSDERDQKQKMAEEICAKANMRESLLESNLANETKQVKDLQARLNTTEVTLRSAQQDVQTLHMEAESAQEKFIRQEEGAKERLSRQADDLTVALEESRNLRMLMTTLETRLAESDKNNGEWERKYNGLETEITEAVRKAAEETQRLAKGEQSWLARQEILEARLQAEAKTRERIEQELARLESIEKQGVRAINENERLATVLGELRSENHKLQLTASRYQREFEEARDSGLREVQRTRISMQTQIDASNHEVNVVRDEYEEQNAKLRAQLEEAKVEIDTARSRADMLSEAAETSKKNEIEAQGRKHQDEMEDMQTRFDRQISILREDSQRSEQNYLERLSLSTSKNDHLQDRIAHLTERLEVSEAAAKAAVEAAKNAVTSSPASRAPSAGSASTAESAAAEKFSAKAFRETIDSLQNQLEASSRKIEELTAQKRRFEKQQDEFDTTNRALTEAEDERQWLNELLDIREADMLELCRAVKSGGDVDVDAARDAAIRLEANIQMHLKGIKKARQARSEPKRALIMAGIREAAPWNSIRDAAPMAAQAFSVFGGWGKGSSQAGLIPAKHSPVPPQTGLLTPPASSARKSSPGESSLHLKKPANSTVSGRRAEKMPASLNPSPLPPDGRQLQTPPMMRTSAYDDDAQAEDFDDAGFFEDE